MKWSKWISAAALLLLTPCGEYVSAQGSPTTQPPGARALEDDALPVDHLVGLYRARINSLPYLLVRYLESGEILILQRLHESLASVDVYVEAMGRSVTNDQQKEVVAKLLAGSQKLKTSVAKTLKSVEDFRRVHHVFNSRSTGLVDWLDARSEALYLWYGPEKEAKVMSWLEIVSHIRAGLLKAVFLNRVSPCVQFTEVERDKAREMWESISRQTKVLIDTAPSKKERDMAATLSRALANLNRLAAELIINRAELNQAWEQTLAVVESLEALMLTPLRGAEPSVRPLETKQKAD
jgi:hypothetical protein